MKANEFFVTTRPREGRAAVLVAKGNSGFTLLGAGGVTTSEASPGCDYLAKLTSLSVDHQIADPNEHGVLAVVVTEPYASGLRNCVFLIPVFRDEEDNTIIDLDHEFAPVADNLGQIVYVQTADGKGKDGPLTRFFIEVVCSTAGGKTTAFTTNPRDASKHYVANGNMLCGLMVNYSSVDEVLKVAQEIRQERSELQQYKEIIQMLFDAAGKMGRFDHLDTFAFSATDDQALEILDPKDFFAWIVGQYHDLDATRTELAKLEADTAWAKGLSSTLQSKLVIEALWELYTALRIHQTGSWFDRCFNDKTWSRVLKSLGSAQSEVLFKQGGKGRQ